MLDLIFGQFQRFFGAARVRFGRFESATGNCDLNWDFNSQAFQGGFLPLQFRFSLGDFFASQFDLVAIGHRIDFCQHLILLDAIVLFNQKSDQVTRNDLWGDIDNVGFDKSIVRDRANYSIEPPGETKI